MELGVRKKVNHLYNLEKLFFLLNDVEIGNICIEHRKDRYFKNKHKLPFNKKSCYLYNFGIFEPYRNKGYGHKVLQYIKKQYENTCIVIEVVNNNQRAIHLYETESFKVFETNSFSTTMIFKP